MVDSRRVRRLCSLIKSRVAEVLMRDMKDPRLGFVTITDVELDRELSVCKVYWSVLGETKDRIKNDRALKHASKFIQHEVAEILPTRNVPELRFVFDESIEGAIRVQKLIEEVNEPSQEDGPEIEPPDEDPTREA